MEKSQFIVVEGIEGAGKTNACRIISKTLKKYQNKNVLYVRQPGSTPIAEQIRCLIKKKQMEKKL